MSLPAILAASAALENLNLVALGINHAYDEPPEVLTDLPVAIRFAEPTARMEASDLMGRYNIFHFKIEVHLARGILQDSYASALSVIRAYQNLYAANLSIGGTCDVCGFREPACEGPVRLRYGTDVVETIGIVFYMEAKEILDDITVSLADGLVDYLKAPLLETGQTTCYAVGDDGDRQIGIATGYTVRDAGHYAGTTNIDVAHYAAPTLSFVAPNTVNDAGAGLVTILAADTIVVKGSGLNDGVYTVAVGGVAGSFTTVEAVVNEGAGTYVSLYKRAAHSNEGVDDLKTGLQWSRNTSTGEKVGPTSNGLLNWYDVATLFTLHPAAADVAMVVPGSIIRIVGGAAELTSYHVGDLVKCTGFVNADNNLPGYYVESVAVNGADLDITIDPSNQTLVNEAAGGARSIGLVTRSCFNYAAGARLAALSNLTDWRVPNRTEGASIMDSEAPTGVPDPVAFPGWVNGYVWSSTSRCDNLANAISLNYSRGALPDASRTFNYCAALVRLGTG